MGYFFKVGDRKDGPISGDTVKRYITEGRIVKSTPLCKEGTDRWVIAGNVPALRSIFHVNHPLAIGEVPILEATKSPKSFFLQAVVIIVLYNLFFFPGLIVNAIWYWKARKTKERTGIAPVGFGFLRWMLILNVLLSILAAIFYVYNPFQKTIDDFYSIMEQSQR